jgi:hypothetical protein
MVISRPRAIIRRTSGWNPGPMCHRGLGHRHCRHAHGVVLWPEGARILGNRLPPAGRRPLGRVLRRQRVPPVSRMGAGGALRAGRPAPLAPLCLWHDRAASRSRCVPIAMAGSAATRGARRSGAVFGECIVAHHFAPPGTVTQPIEAGYMAADRSWLYGRRSKLAIWPMPGCSCVIPDCDELRRRADPGTPTDCARTRERQSGHRPTCPHVRRSRMRRGSFSAPPSCGAAPGADAATCTGRHG